MQNAYVSSSIYSIGTHGSLSYSFNGCSYLLNERFDRNPVHFSSSSSSKSCCCSCCCGFSNQRVSINPCYLYGLRQSSLLQWSASRRLILNGGDRCSYRIQECSPDLGCNELPCTVPERSVYSRRGRRRKGRRHCIVDGEADNEVYNSSEVYDSGDLDDAEAMLSLLSEELGEDFFGRERSGFSFKRLELEGRRRVMSGRDRNVSTSKRVEEESWRSLIGRERKVSSSKRVEKERRRNFSSRERNLCLSARVEAEGRRNFSGRERNVGSFTRVEAERRAFGGREKSGSSSKGVQVEIEGTSSEGISGKKKSNGMLSSLESNSIQFEPTTIDLSEGDTRQKEEERGMILRGDNRRGRKGGSSCSSYYSFLSSGDFGSETDVQDKHGIFEEPASSLYKDSKYDKGGRVDGQASEDYQNYRDDSEGNGERKYQRNTTAEGGVMWDWRKKTEKKLTEVVTEEKRGDEKSSRVLKTNQSELQNASGSRKQLHDEHESSYFTTGAREQNSQTGNQVVGIDMTDSRRRFQERNESDIYRNDVATTSWSKRHSEREENLEITTNLGQETKNEHYKTASYIRQKEDLNRDTQKGSRTSETRVVDAERTSDWQRQSDTRRVYQEENRNMLPSSASETEVQRHQIDQQIVGFIKSGRKSQQITEISEISDSGIERDNIIQSDLVPASSGESSEPRHEIDEKAFQRVLSRKGTDDVTEMSLVHASNTERNSNSQRMSKKRTVNQESAIISASPSIEEATQRNNETDVKLMQVKPTKEAQSSRGPSNFHKKDSLEASSFQASFSMVSQATMQPHDVQEHKRTPQAILLPPSSQLIAKGSLCIESPSAMATQEVSEEISDGCSPAGRQTSASLQESSVASGNTEAQGEILYLIPEDALGSTYRLEKSSSLFVRDFVQKVRHQGSTSQNQNENTVSEANLVYGGEGHGLSTSVSLQESCSGDGNPQTQGEIISLINPEDALDSAHRLEKSSSQFVGDFSERVRHEVSTSENQNANTVSEAKLVHGGEEYGQRNSGKKGAENSQTKENDSRRSSGGSGTKGPADEMWDVADTSVLKTPKAETLELATIIGNAPKAEKTEAATTSGNAIVKRSGRSVWNIVADIVRLRWGLQAESPRSAVKSGGRTSSNESASSEAWFSGREPEESGEKNEKRDKDMLPETTSDQQQPGKTFSQSRGEVFGIMRSKDTVRYLEAGMPSSTNKEEGGLTSKSISLSSSEETLDSQENQKSFPDSSSGIAKVESSQPLVSRGTRSPLVEEISNSGNTVSGSGSMEDMDQFGSRKLTEVSDNMQKGGELKQRRFQRTKQVLRDRFDEWEEAHTLEIEQRKIDEMFMREALLEAKKAADTWEVPVGAVIVQQGKVIARGFNLVEELRDSTAHAEMICIREASNLLRSWRLADATLYVTLEPCPMCAGAILQARIDTVVWGAPNKLLGADGSWIRLFPDGSGANSSEQSDKPAPPVHPFHPNMTIRRGVLASECADIMQQFFQLRRKKKGKQADPPAPASHRPVSHHPSKILTKMHDIFHLMFCL